MADELFDLGFNGITQSVGYEEDNQIITVEQMPAKNVQAILDQNRRDEAAAKARIGRTDMGVIGARVDIVTHHNWKQEWRTTARQWGIPWHKFLKAKLNDPDNKHMRFMKL